MKLIAFVLVFGFWHYNPSANEMEYFIASAHEAQHTCGFVSRGSDGMYVADALASGGASESISMEFNTMDGAKAFVESKCGGVR